MEFPPQSHHDYTPIRVRFKPEEVIVLAPKHKQAKEFDTNCVLLVRKNFISPPFGRVG